MREGEEEEERQKRGEGIMQARGSFAFTQDGGGRQKGLICPVLFPPPPRLLIEGSHSCLQPSPPRPSWNLPNPEHEA